MRAKQMCAQWYKYSMAALPNFHTSIREWSVPKKESVSFILLLLKYILILRYKKNYDKSSLDIFWVKTIAESYLCNYRKMDTLILVYSYNGWDPGLKPGSPAFQVSSLTMWATREAPVMEPYTAFNKELELHMSLWISQSHVVEGTSLVVQGLRLLAPNASSLSFHPWSRN